MLAVGPDEDAATRKDLDAAEQPQEESGTQEKSRLSEKEVIDLIALAHTMAARLVPAPDAADVAQEAVFTVLHKFPHVSVGQRNAILRRVVMNMTTRLLERQRRTASALEVGPEEVVKDIAEDIVGAREVRELLRVLSPDQLQFVVLHYGQGLSMAEVASTLGMTEHSVRVLKRMAAQRIRKHVHELEQKSAADNADEAG